MTPSQDILQHIIPAGNDIFYIDVPELQIPETIEYNSKIYYRFCDFILLPDTTENLTPHQIAIAMELRKKYFDTHLQHEINSAVRIVFKELIKLLRPKSILEIGPNSNPLLSEKNEYLYYSIDINPATVEYLKTQGIKAQLITEKSVIENTDQSIDLVIAAFVFQFDIAIHQIRELYRILNENGILIANVYRRSKESRLQLLADFKNIGFKYLILNDPKKLCKNHEYWFLFKGRLNLRKEELLPLLKS